MGLKNCQNVSPIDRDVYDTLVLSSILSLIPYTLNSNPTQSYVIKVIIKSTKYTWK